METLDAKKQKRLDTQRRYREKNKELLKEKNHQYRKENPHIDKEYRENNREKINIKRKQYRVNNREKVKETNKKYRDNYPLKEKLRHYKSSATKRGINFNLTLEWLEQQIKLEEYNICAISGVRFVDEPFHPFSRSLDRVNNSRGYTPDNVKWVCFKYNSWKSDLSHEEVNMIVEYMNKNVSKPLTVQPR